MRHIFLLAMLLAVELERAVSGVWDGQQIESIPLGERRQSPRSKRS